jgi:hypothetical protein
MRYLVLGFLLCFGGLAMAPQPAAIAQDQAEKPKREASDSWPFHDAMSWQDAEKAIDAAIKGDKDALQRLRDGRLSHISLMLSNRYRNACRNFAHRLLIENLGWLKEMMAWEMHLGLCRSDQIEASYKQRQQMFQFHEPQLARAIIATARLGDLDCAKRLAALEPKSPWVIAAQGFMGMYPTHAANARAMLPAVALHTEYYKYSFSVSPGLLTPDGFQLSFGSNEYVAHDVDELLDEGHMVSIWSTPYDWTSGTLQTSAAIYAGLSGDPKLLAEVQEAVASTGMTPKLQEQNRDLARHLSGEPLKRSVSAVEAANYRFALLPTYLLSLPPEHTLARISCAAAAYHAAPLWPFARRTLLSECAATGDPELLRVAARAVLATTPDDLEAIADVCRALHQSGLMKDAAAAMLKAASASKNSRLSAWATKALKNDFGKPKHELLKLPIAEQAALLAPLAGRDELAACGTAEAMLWADRCRFALGRREVMKAWDAAGACLQAAATKFGTTECLGLTAELAAELDWYTTDWDDIAFLAAKWEKPYPLAHKAHESLRKTQKGNFRHDAPKDARAHFEITTFFNRTTGPFPGEAADVMLQKPMRSAGFGRAMAGRAAWYAGEFARYPAFVQAAVDASPCSPVTLLTFTSWREWIGRNALGNWVAAESRMLRTLMISPWSLDSIGSLATFMARSGQSGSALGPLMLASLSMAITPPRSTNMLVRLQHMRHVRVFSSMVAMRLGGHFGNQLGASARATLVECISNTQWGLGVENGANLLGLLGVLPHYMSETLDTEFHNRGTENVDMLLNMSLQLQRIDPARSIELVNKSREIGVSSYGRFVGTQSLVRGRAALGDVKGALEAYNSARDGRVGVPRYLDYMLLFGLAEGNQHQGLAEALAEIEAREPAQEGIYYCYALRRSLMAAGRHAEVSKVPLVLPEQLGLDSHNLRPWAPLFHESTHLLQQKQFSELAQRARTYMDSREEDTVGVYLDACLLLAIARKLDPAEKDKPLVNADGTLSVMAAGWENRLDLDARTLDSLAIRALSGGSTVLPAVSLHHFWQGSRYSERPLLYLGAGMLKAGECEARDHYVRGVIAWLKNDNAAARKQLEACVKCDQRFSHEYHVAVELLAKYVPK